MKAILLYLAQLFIASGILYGYYHFILRNNKFHKYNRYYLLLAAMASIIVPFLNIPIYFTQQQAESSVVVQTLTSFSSTGLITEGPAIHPEASPIRTNWFTWTHILYLVYSFITLLTLSRMVISLLKIRTIIRRNPVEQLDRIYFVN